MTTQEKRKGVESLDDVQEPPTKKAKTATGKEDKRPRNDAVKLVIFGCTENPAKAFEYEGKWSAMALWCGDEKTEHETVFHGEPPESGVCEFNAEFKKPIGTEEALRNFIELVHKPWEFLEGAEQGSLRGSELRELLPWADYFASTRVMDYCDRRILNLIRCHHYGSSDTQLVYDCIMRSRPQTQRFINYIHALAQDGSIIIKGTGRLSPEEFMHYSPIHHALKRRKCMPYVNPSFYKLDQSDIYYFESDDLTDRVLLEVDTNSKFNIAKYRYKKIKERCLSDFGGVMSEETWATICSNNGFQVGEYDDPPSTTSSGGSDNNTSSSSSNSQPGN